MPTKAEILWFKSTFGGAMQRALVGTPFSIDLLTAIACQETGYLWQVLRKTLSTEDVLALCVGDTIDASGGRSAFPRTKDALIAASRGDEMFAIARSALEGIADYNSGYANAAKNTNKFCRGYGIFQYDLQFFLEDPEYFLKRRWGDFESCLEKFLGELKAALDRFSWGDRESLTDEEQAYVAVRYNRGGFDWGRKLRQGHFSGGRYYGEWIAHYLALSKTVQLPKGLRKGAAGKAAKSKSAKRGTTSARRDFGGARSVASYYPHWVWRRGDITRSVMERLPAGSIIGVHHRWSADIITEILEYPGKDFVISWYCESNTLEEADDATGDPIEDRIWEARATQDHLEQRYSKARFADLIELDAARDKKLGHLDGPGNSVADWLADARAVKAAGFRYLAKSPMPGHVNELRQKLGADFVPRIVFEDVVKDKDYCHDAIALAETGHVVTLVIHEGGFDGDPGATLQQAEKTVQEHFSGEQMRVEAFHGKPEDNDTAFVRILAFSGTEAAHKRLAGFSHSFDATAAVMQRVSRSGPTAMPVPGLGPETSLATLSFAPRLGPETRSAALPALRLGMQGDLVRAWQSFLLGQGFDPGGLDGDFGDKTVEATRAFQQRHGLVADGVAGRSTLLKAAERGFELIEEPADDMSGSNFPPRPNFPPLLSTVARQHVFGAFEHVAAPTARNPEAIRILGTWVQDNIIMVPIPQLHKALGASAPSGMKFHRRVAAQLIGLWEDWEREGLLDRIQSFDGAFVARFIRGSQTNLSNHAFGSAFDINASSNGLGVRPPLVGKAGSVRELVPLAHKWGFYWGGHFGQRPDGMHFEIAQLTP